MSSKFSPVLIIGGSGVVGSQAAKAIRRLHPGLPLAIGGRDLSRAQAVADEVGGAIGVVVDLDRADLGLDDNAAFSAVVIFVKDERLTSMRYAQNKGIPYISLSSGTFEVGPEVAQYIHAPDKAPILLASHWLAGAAIFPVLDTLSSYETVDAIRIGVLLDEEDMGGPAALADYNRITGNAPASLTVKDGKLHWASGQEALARYRSVDGVELDAAAYSPFDVMALAARTGAKEIRLDLAYSVSASRRRGEPFSTEITLEVAGQAKDGEPLTLRHEIVHPQGQAPLTALGVALAVERMLGLAGGEAPKAGLYLPEVLIEPAYYVSRMKEFGTSFVDH
ncbi:saccharopine dehydrogenase [Ensifer adhaerens]|uniref:Saccharopine dehydrogenase n=1 Tax=Ensifer adhaerens TaxID=106592 RepID=A0A0L8BTD0_ENSAD|nr:saccharopine dehydrogenase [Ensifer adhaerens]KOF17962.1 saccharopine dehydrogenase [Ensifer adhaerens]